jgi:hypothetical protein
MFRISCSTKLAISGRKPLRICASTAAESFSVPLPILVVECLADAAAADSGIGNSVGALENVHKSALFRLSHRRLNLVKY